MKQTTSIVTILGADRPGIIARVTGLLFSRRFNLEDISMTILDGEFAMILICSGTQEPKKMQTILESDLKKWNVTVYWKTMEKPKRAKKNSQGAISFIVNAIGRDKTGIVYGVSRILAARHLNITDMNSRVLHYRTHKIYSLMLQVDIPKKFPVQSLEQQLSGLARKLKIEIHLRPAEKIEM